MEGTLDQYRNQCVPSCIGTHRGCADSVRGIYQVVYREAKQAFRIYDTLCGAFGTVCSGAVVYAFVQGSLHVPHVVQQLSVNLFVFL